MEVTVSSGCEVLEDTHFYFSENINSVVREWLEHIFLSAVSECAS